MTDCDRIFEAVSAYDPNADVAGVVKAEEQRQQFLELFPRSGWDTMSLDRYALGQADHPDNFCRWMEFVTTELGSMKGGSARKHLIYYQAGPNQWWFDQKLFANVEDAWRAVHQGFVDAIAHADAGDWDKIGNIAALRGGPALVNKTLSVYYPDELLPINSQAHLRHFLRELGYPRADDSNLGTTALNRILLTEVRACSALDGRTTKEIERVLYWSDLDPFTAGLTDGPINKVAEFIADTLAEAGDDRVEARRQAEDEARRLLDRSAGEMSESDVRELLRLFNVDFSKGRPVGSRFSPAFVGQTANALATNLAGLNSWTGRIWSDSPEAADAAVDQLLADRRALPAAGTSYPTMLMYLLDPETNAVWARMTDQGLRRLSSYKPARNPASGRIDDYRRFCVAAQELMAAYNVPPELLDYLLAAAGRATVVVEPPPPTANVWLFQANPSIYNIDQALAESADISWVVRQHASRVRAGDRVYIWRSGKDAGVVATATVASDPETLPGEQDDPFVLKPDALSQSESRVRLLIDSVLPSVVRRVDMVGHPVLGGLAVIRQPNATNFEVTAAEDVALRLHVSGFQIPQLSEDLADRVHLPRPWLQEAIDLLSEKGQVVFYGPPGTGKTFVALALAEEITKDGGAHRIVQFHPSYSYEDFVGGFRPVEDDGAHGVKYQRADGPLRAIAAEAAADPPHPYVLIIDEINRGNIPKIFGELLFLLEYRQKEVRLQYWPEKPFSLPRNLLLIGTMNTADRSIALVDAALRRRFYFVPFIPTADPVKDVLGKWLKRYELSAEPAQLLAALNDQIAKDDISIGPSYFMTDPQAGPALERIWSRAVMPLLDEYYFGTSWDRGQFELRALRARLARDVPAAQNSAPASDDSPA